MHGAEGDSNPTGLHGAGWNSLHLALCTQPGTVFGVFLSTAKFWQEWRKKTFPSHIAAAFLSHLDCGGRGAEGRAAPPPPGLRGTDVPARQARGLSTLASGLPCHRGRGGQEAGLPAPPPGRTVSACPVTAVQPDPPHRAAPLLASARGRRGEPPWRRTPPAPSRFSWWSSPGGSLPSAPAPAPQREATAATELRKPAAIYPGAGGRSAGGQGRWEDRWDGLFPSLSPEVCVWEGFDLRCFDSPPHRQRDACVLCGPGSTLAAATLAWACFDFPAGKRA